MGDGYTRQSAADIVTGNVVEAGPLNAEFNQIRDAFQESSGHSHDGTVGEGPKISLTTSISGVLPVANGGFAGIHKVNATTAPVAADDSGDGYAVGSVWLDTTNDKAYICVDSTLGAAIWQLIGASTGWQPLDTDLTAIAALTSAANKVPYSTGAGTWALADFSAFGRSIVDDADAAALLTTLGITPTVTELNYVDGVTSAIQTQLDAKQALDADLTALAALSGTNTIYYRSAANTWTAVTIGGGLSFAAGTLDAVASSLDATLTSIAALGTAADKGIYFTGIDTAAEFTLTSFARTLLDDADAATARSTLGLAIGTNVQAYDAELAALAGLTSAADSLPYFTGSGTAALATFTAAGRALVDDADASAQRTTLGLAIGTNVQAYDTTLTELAAISGVAGDTIYADGTDSWTRLPKGTASQVLTMNAGATAPEWATAASGGMTLLGTLTTTSGATKELTSIAAGYRELLLELDAVSSTSSMKFGVELSSTNGAAYGTVVSMQSAFNGGASAVLSGTIRIGNISSTVAAAKSWSCQISDLPASPNAGTISTNSAAVVDAIRVSTQGGTFDAGSIRIYGVS